MGFVGLCVAAATIGAFVWALFLQGAQNRASVLQRALPLVEEGRLEGELARHRLRGRVAGRELELEVRFRPSLRGPARYPIRARLALENAPAVSLRIRRDAGLAAIQKLTGRVVDVEVAGGDRFDQRYLVEAPSEADRAGLAAREVRSRIHQLIAIWKLDEVRIDGPWVEVFGDTSHLDRRLLQDLLETLAVLTHAYDRSPVTSLTPRPVFAWTGGEDSQPRCPFCHDALGRDPCEVGACSGCGTLIHLDCHRELGRCAIMGCEALGVERQGPLTISLPA